ncbi:thioredoxin family protein [Glaciecola petra]|uniref:Thioredoxin family protein n=1 Tax=Glaciecola petra TaxID=3075602 RepID=A0ABU2ZRU6_9ALTE|nr:thioredoxin family protein [Aestuariibacter sp. P117]MDT0595351.1 thioredoxin family protein [Aestuariibacter sp. P117]
MNKRLIQLGIILVIVGAVYYGNKMLNAYWGKEAVGQYAFAIYDLDRAKALAAEQGKLVLADYSAIWCPSCRKLSTQVFAQDSIAGSINANFIYARLDYDSEEGKQFAADHELIGFPRVLVLNPTGEKLVEMPLTFEAPEYLQNLEQVTTRYLP